MPEREILIAFIIPWGFCHEHLHIILQFPKPEAVKRILNQKTYLIESSSTVINNVTIMNYFIVWI